MIKNSELTIEQVLLLKKPLPAAAIKKHPTKTYLSSINSIYVVERLNDVFGVGKWTQTSKCVMKVEKVRANGTKHFEIVLKCRLEITEYGILLENYGGNDNEDLGDAFKGAMTDALTKMASYLGIGAHVWKGDPTPQPQQIDHVTQLDALFKLKKAKSLDDLKGIWISLSKKAQTDDEVINLAKELKVKFTTADPEPIETEEYADENEGAIDTEATADEQALLATLSLAKTASDWIFILSKAYTQFPELKNATTEKRINDLKATKKFK